MCNEKCVRFYVKVRLPLITSAVSPFWAPNNASIAVTRHCAGRYNSTNARPNSECRKADPVTYWYVTPFIRGIRGPFPIGIRGVGKLEISPPIFAIMPRVMSDNIRGPAEWKSAWSSLVQTQLQTSASNNHVRDSKRNFISLNYNCIKVSMKEVSLISLLKYLRSNFSCQTYIFRQLQQWRKGNWI